MRFLNLIVLAILAGAIGIFAVENREMMTLEYFGQSVTCSRSLLVGVVYLLGMASGSIVVGFVRRALWRAANSPSQ